MQTSTQTGSQATRKDTAYFITYSISFISLGLAMASLGPILPFLAENTGVSIGQISFLFTARSLGYLTGSAGGGRLYDRFKGHKLMILSVSAMVLAAFFIPLISWFYLLLPVMFLLGLGEGTLDVGGNVNLVWVFQSRVGPYMNALHFFFGLGAFLAPIVITNVMGWTGGALTWPLWVLSLLFLPGLFGMFRLPSPQNPDRDAEGHTEKGQNGYLVVLMIVVFFMYVGLEAGFGGWIFTYATELNIANESAAAYMNSIFWGALTLGRLISIPLAKKLSPAALLVGNFVLSVVFMGVILIWPLSSTMIWIGAAGLGLALSSVFPTLLSLAETRMQMTGGVTGLFFLGGSLGGTLIPSLLGQIFEYIGGYEVMLTLFGASAVGLIFLVAVILASNKLGEKTRGTAV
jgi:FHS family Na+ dependent glucose MFS transporter 1